MCFTAVIDYLVLYIITVFCVCVKVPQLFVDGHYIGDELEIQRLHETGELADILGMTHEAESE